MSDKYLHWSERAKMQPDHSVSGPGPSASPRSPYRQPGSNKRRSRGGPSKGLWAALAVIVVAAAVAAAVFLWYLPNRDDSGGVTLGPDDLAAQSLVRYAMTAIESAYVDTRTFDPATTTPEILQRIEPSVTFIPQSNSILCHNPTASAAEGAVEYWGFGSTYAVGTLSASGLSFSVEVDKGTGGGVEYYVEGEQANW